MSNGISRRHFFFGTLLAGVIPRGGFGSAVAEGARLPVAQREAEHRRHRRRRPRHRASSAAASRRTSSRSPTWTGRAARKGSSAGTRRRSTRTSARCSTRRKSIDAVHDRASPITCTRTSRSRRMQRGKHVYVEKPLTRTPWEARLLTDAAAKYKVATQMGNQGYSHEATRVAAEILWSGEIGDVTEVHSFRGRASWPQGMQTCRRRARCPTRSIGTRGWRRAIAPVHVAATRRTARSTTSSSVSTCRSTGAASTISAAA